MDQIPDDSASPDSSSHIRESRRRRTRRLIVPEDKTERAIYVNDIARRLVPDLNFYLLSLLCGVVLAAAILFDHPALYFLSALVAPFMAPLVGLGFSTAVGSFGFFLQFLGSLAIGSGMMFLCGALSGWLSKLWSGFAGSQIAFHTAITFPDLILVLVGSVLAILLTVRNPKQRSTLASAALAYEVYLPIGVAGFGLTSGFHSVSLPALQTAGINILLVIAIGAIVAAFLKLRPSTFFGYLLTAVLLAGGVYALISTGAVRSSLQSPSVTAIETTAAIQTTESGLGPVAPTITPRPPTSTLPVTMKATATNTLVPTFTPTVTNTPKPTDVYATINEPLGVYARENPCNDDVQCPKIIPALPDKTPVLVLALTEDKAWAQIRLEDGRQGWVLISYIQLDTP